jgi:hypothetical protein
MVRDLLVHAVCHIPLEYRRPGGKSLQQLVMESGYFEKRGELSVSAVEQYLREHSRLVDDWFGYCEDKRTPAGWYVISEGDRFVVGRVDGDRIEFPDRVAACAEFVVREIGEVTLPR